jgi:hypothetical protein
MLIYGVYDCVIGDGFYYFIWGSLVILLFLPLQTKVRKYFNYSTWPFSIVVFIFNLLIISFIYGERGRFEVPSGTIFNYNHGLYPEVLRDCLLSGIAITFLIFPSLIYFKRLIAVHLIKSAEQDATPNH